MNLFNLIFVVSVICSAKAKSLVKIQKESSIIERIILLQKDQIQELNNNPLNEEINQNNAENKSNNKNNVSVGENKLRVIQTPKVYFEQAAVTLEAMCNVSEAKVGVDISVYKTSLETYNIHNHRDIRVFRKILKCSKTDFYKRYKIGLKLPRYLAYKPGYFNKFSVYIEEAILSVWLMSDVDYTHLISNNQSISGGQIIFSSSLKILKPFERPEKPVRVCYKWLTNILNEIKKSTYRPTCLCEEEVVKAIRFPVALSGLQTGVYRTYNAYHNLIPRNRQIHRITKPEFSFVLWLYINDYCLNKLNSGSILQHITWNDNYATPQISVNRQGRVVTEMVMEDGTSTLDLSGSHQVLPRFHWLRLVLACVPARCNLTINHGENWKDGWTRMINLQSSSSFYFDETVGLIVYGGSEIGASFQGYIGQAIFYRTKAIQTHQIPQISSDNVMMRLQLTQKESRCSRYTDYLNYLIDRLRKKVISRLERTTCDVVPLFPSMKTPQEQCSSLKPQKTLHYKFVHKLMKNYAREGQLVSRQDIAYDIYEEAEFLLESKGPKKMDLIITLLKQSSCLGNHDATYMLSVLLNYGLTVESQEIMSHSYLMDGGLAGNRLCLLSLANKHVYGLDGFPVDLEQAYVYLKAVADMTNRDLTVHNQNDVYTEMVRLTNHYEVNEQTEENGDVVTYLKLQASQGDFSAIQTLARMYYWGSRGLERDVARAVEFYRMAAEQNQPSALYDYGIILMKGHGVEKNVSQAVKMLKKAADLGYTQALNTLGWYYMGIVENYTEAASLFHKAHELGNKDASFNLAYMLLSGIYPNHGVDKIKAWEFLSAGALRGQYDASILVGMYNIRGHPNITRNLNLAIGWTRYVAEQNPGIGRLLFKGVKAYKKLNWFSTLVYYLMAASTGVEVANFNLAYLCEEDNGGFVKQLEKECVWRHYNLSIQRSPKDVDPYAWNKMAHYYYYHGIDGRNDTQTAIELYARAALMGDPQGLYNLAMLSNDGVMINEYILNQLTVPLSIQKNNLLLSFHLLNQCQNSYNQEAYLPCTFAMYRVAFAHYWRLINVHYKRIFSVVIMILISLVSLNIIHHRQTRPHIIYL